MNPTTPPPSLPDFQRGLREMNDALLICSVHQHELIEQAERVEAALRKSEQELAAELDAVQQLHQVSLRLADAGNSQALYESIMDAAVSIMRSEFASMQLLLPDRNGGELHLLAFHGFDAEAAAFWGRVHADSQTPCGMALRTGARSVVQDVEECHWMAGTEDLFTFRHAGIRAAQSTPLVSRKGNLVGMISTHWRRPHEPSERDLRLFDLLARQATDLIERKQAEDALRASEDRLRIAIESTHLGTWDFNPVTGELSWDERCKALFALPDDAEVSYPAFLNALHPADRERTHEAVRRALDPASGGSFETEYRAVGIRDGVERWIAARGEAFFDESGRAIRFVGTALDVTRRKRAEQALAESEIRYRNLFESMDEGYCIIEMIFDPPGSERAVDYRFLEVNPAFEAQSGMHDVTGRRMLEFVPTIEEHWLTNYGRVALTGEPIRFANEYKSLHRWFDVYAFRVGTPASRRVAVLFTDITRRKHDDEVIRAARGAADSASRAKDRFLAVLSHELRTPLTPVVLTIAAMEQDPDLPSPMREDVAMIRRNVELESKLIDDLLDLSRVASGKLRLQMQPTSAHALLRYVAESSARDTSGKRLNVSLDLRASQDQVSADPARLQQVFWNVLRNAIKFTPEGGHISIRSENDRNGKLRLIVRDTGAGIPADVLPKVFDAFEQGDIKTSRHFGGLGLGLAICKALVEMHGGTIRAKSEGAGKGATFTIKLPTVRVRETRPEESQATDLAKSANGSRVLLVEDHPDTVRALSRLLGQSGYQVKTASSIASALQLAASEPFDIVLSDIGLPDGTGYELMEQIRERHGIKGIALSGYGMDEDIKRSMEAGFVDHVVKPVDLARLESVMRQVAGRENERV